MFWGREEREGGREEEEGRGGERGMLVGSSPSIHKTITKVETGEVGSSDINGGFGLTCFR